MNESTPNVKLSIGGEVSFSESKRKHPPGLTLRARHCLPARRFSFFPFLILEKASMYFAAAGPYHVISVFIHIQHKQSGGSSARCAYDPTPSSW